MSRLFANRRDLLRTAQRFPRSNLGGANGNGRGRRFFCGEQLVTAGFGQLTDHDIRWLIEALRSGRLRIPVSAMSLQPALPADRAQAAADAMAALVEEGATSEALLRVFLAALAGDRSSRPGVSDAIELVATGPTAPGVTCRDTSIVVSQLFANAEATVLVAGYAVYQGRSLFRSLADRMESRPS